MELIRGPIFIYLFMEMTTNVPIISSCFLFTEQVFHIDLIESDIKTCQPNDLFVKNVHSKQLHLILIIRSDNSKHKIALVYPKILLILNCQSSNNCNAC